MSEHHPHGRVRPPDPAGTQPKTDHGALEPPGRSEQLLLTAGDDRPSPERAAGPEAQPSAPPAADGRGADAERLVLQSDLPEAMALLEPVVRSADLERRKDAPPAQRGEPAGESQSTPKFQFLFGVLGALGVAAIALAVAVGLTHSSASAGRTEPWSAWQPTSGNGDTAAQIARHVGAQYRLPNGKQLLKVSGGPQAISGQPVVLALRTSGTEPTSLPNNGVFYQLCGGGPSCSISDGKATVERGLLVKREALELALYTFHFLSGASQVVVTFPPPPPSKAKKGSAATSTAAEIPTIATDSGSSTSTSASASASSSTSIQPPSHVLLFRPEELTSELEQPLDKTLSWMTPTVDTMNSSPDAKTVERLTTNAIYDSVLIQDPSSGLVMLLQPPSLGG